MLYCTKIFKDGTLWDNSFQESRDWSAAEQLKDFLRLFPSIEIISISYSVTHEGYNSYGVAKYRNHILLVYKD